VVITVGTATSQTGVTIAVKPKPAMQSP
jgi:hypothetical protein